MSHAPVVVIEEPGRTPLHLVVREPLEVGRDGTGVLLDDPQISRRHLQLRPRAGSVYVRDLGSTHGTWVDDAPLGQEERELTSGMVVRFGNATVTLAGSQAAPAPRAPVEPSSLTSIERVAGAVSGEAADLVRQVATDRTLTIVFTDIESSTEISSTIGDAEWFDVLSNHYELVRNLVAAHGGHEVKSQGDGFMLTFESARRAAYTMAAVQQATESSPDQVRIRVGMHTGEALADDDGDLFGRHVNMAARVANEAAGAEILLSTITREIVESRGDLHFGESRPVELKGLPGTHRVHPLLWQDMNPTTAM